MTGFLNYFIYFLGPVLNDSLLSSHFHGLRLPHWFHREQKEIKPSRSPSSALPILLIQMQISWTVKMPWHRHTHTYEFAISQVGQLLPLPPSPTRNPLGKLLETLLPSTEDEVLRGICLFISRLPCCKYQTSRLTQCVAVK